MKVQEYRDLISHAFDMASELKSAADDGERSRWLGPAERLRLELWACKDAAPRATPRDRERMQLATARLDEAYQSVAHLIFADRSIFGL